MEDAKGGDCAEGKGWKWEFERGATSGFNGAAWNWEAILQWRHEAVRGEAGFFYVALGRASFLLEGNLCPPPSLR